MRKMNRASEAVLWFLIVLATAVVLLIIAHLSKVHAADQFVCFDGNAPCPCNGE